MTVATRERPIIFSAPMVRAILNGSKTQTRRAMKPQPTSHTDPQGRPMLRWHGRGHRSCQLWAEHFAEGVAKMCDFPGTKSYCPYGTVGDRLWVREAWWHRGGYTTDVNGETSFIRSARAPENVRFVADYADDDRPKAEYLYDGWARAPAIFLPHALSRITLEIAGIRVQRVQDIYEIDCEAELGVPAYSLGNDAYPRFAAVWEQINGKRGHGWDTNPWVWAITFRRVEVTR